MYREDIMARMPEKEVRMNGISGVSFQETEHGLLVHVKKSSKSSAGKLKRKIPYNFKTISRDITQAKTSNSARSLIAKIHSKIAFLSRILKSEDYNETEVTAALNHAKAMERIAKRKIHNLEQEENMASRSPENEVFDEEQIQEDMEINQEERISTEELSEEMMKELEEEMDDMMSDLEELTSFMSGDVSEEDLDELKRKHRSDEQRRLTRADMDYLKALFEGLERERRQNASGISSSGSRNDSTISMAISCIPEAEMVDVDVGGSVDISV